jgi:hypothetical protein
MSKMNNRNIVTTTIIVISRFLIKAVINHLNPVDEKVSLTDPDAAPMRGQGGGRAVLGYRDHYIVDGGTPQRSGGGGKARIILSALVSPASIMDNTPLLDLVDWTCSRWQLEPRIAVGDTKYGTVPNIVGLEERSIKAYLPTPDLSKRSEYYSST